MILHNPSVQISVKELDFFLRDYFEINRPPDFACQTTRMGLATKTDE